MGQIGPLQLLIIALLAMLLFGATRISEIGKGLGEGIKNFKKGLRDDESPKQIGDGAKKESKNDAPQVSGEGE